MSNVTQDNAGTYVSTFDAVARYSVDRLDGFGKTSKVRTLHSGKTYEEARSLERAETEKLRAEPGYREGTMDRPIIGVRLENEAEARAAIAKARGG